MARTMYDGVTAGSLPANAAIVAGYVDGTYRWSASDWARFPHAVKVQIAVSAGSVADVLDVETGNDMTPSHWVSWVKLCRSHGRSPAIYMNTSTWSQVRHAFLSTGTPEPLYWVAQYDGNASIPAGAVAKQYASNNSYDTSVTTDSWPGGAAPAPAPTPAPTVRRNDMHANLKLNEPVVFTNPAAALGGTSTLLLATDFGDSQVRVASFDISGHPTVTEHAVNTTGSAVRISLPSAVNKLSVEVTSGTGVVGLDVLA
jgi:hypothetical protein